MVQQKVNLPEQLTISVVTPVPLSAKNKRKLMQIWRSALGVPKIIIDEKITPSLLGGIQVRIASCMIDLSVNKKLQQINQMLRYADLSRLSVGQFQDLLNENNNQFVPVIEKVGRVESVKDGIVRVAGMKQVKAGELIQFENNLCGIVFNIGTQFCDVVLLANDTHLNEGSTAIQTGSVVKVPVGKALLGRVVDALGNALDNQGAIHATQQKPIETAAPGIMERTPVHKPFQTGTKIIDALIPIGLGQRELIIGDRQTGKTTLLIDAILNQKKHNATASSKDKIYCVYVAIGQKKSAVAQIVHTLKEQGAMDYTCIVCASASDTAALQYIAPFTATTIAEFFRDKGMNAVVFYDDLSKHANAYRQLSLLLRRPPGREAYPGDIFYLHSRLLERAAMMSDGKGGGSLTAIPVVETQEGDVSAYIPTNVISITDGQIFLESGLFNQNIRPAVNIGLSVSRIGSKAQHPLIAKLASSMKLELSQYREMLSFAQIASDLDSSAQDLLKKGNRITQALRQIAHKPVVFCDEFLCLYSLSCGLYEHIEADKIPEYEPVISDYFHKQYPNLVDEIETATQNLSGDILNQIYEALKEALTFVLSQKDEKNEQSQSA